MNKKGVQLSLQAVIIALMLLIVMVVVIFVFTKYLGQQGTVVGNTTTAVGNCAINPNDKNCKIVDGIRTTTPLILPFFFRRKKHL